MFGMNRKTNFIKVYKKKKSAKKNYISSRFIVIPKTSLACMNDIVNFLNNETT